MKTTMYQRALRPAAIMPWCVAATILATLAPVEVHAQESRSAEAAVKIDTGVTYFFQGRHYPSVRRSAEFYESAIEEFSQALSIEPGNRTALLFRSLTYGELGLAQKRNFFRLTDRRAWAELALEFLENPARREEMSAQLEELKAVLEDTTLPGAERVQVRTRVQRIETNLIEASALEGQGRDAVKKILEDTDAERRDVAKNQREQFESMLVDLESLIESSDEPETIIRLLEVVARFKISRLRESEAAPTATGGEGKGGSTLEPALQARIDRELKQVEDILEHMLREYPLEGVNLIRTKFFLGVVLFREGVTRKGDGAPDEQDLSKLARAEQLMRDIAESDADRTWRSYAALYLGLIVPFRVIDAESTEDRDRILDDASHWLDVALDLDKEIPEGAPLEVTSRSSFIPEVSWKQEQEIDRLRTVDISKAELRRDVAITFFAGVQRDTNVVLLGGRTDLPYDVSRKADYGFSTGVSIGYTHDLTDRLSFGIEGRASSLWHADVDSFDEQNYGASAAIQYRLMDKKETFGPVYARLQYDYDYTLLGRRGFLSSNRITPELRAYWLDDRAETSVYFSYEIRDYFERLSDLRTRRGGEYFRIGVTQRFDVVDMNEVYEKWGVTSWGHKNDPELAQDGGEYPRRFLTPFVAWEYGWDQTSGTEFDQDAISTVFGAKVPLPWGVDLNASAEFEWEDYRNGSVIDFHRNVREDFIQRYRVELARTFVLVPGERQNRFRPAIDRVLMTLTAHATLTDDDSNVVDRLGQSIFEYDRALFGMTVAFSFN